MCQFRHGAAFNLTRLSLAGTVFGFAYSVVCVSYYTAISRRAAWDAGVVDLQLGFLAVGSCRCGESRGSADDRVNIRLPQTGQAVWESVEASEYFSLPGLSHLDTTMPRHSHCGGAFVPKRLRRESRLPGPSSRMLVVGSVSAMRP